MPQASLIEVTPTRGVRVLGGFEDDVAMWALAVVRVGVGLGLVVSFDGKKAKPRGCVKPKDAGREESRLGDPLVGDDGSARTYAPLAQLRLVMDFHESRQPPFVVDSVHLLPPQTSRSTKSGRDERARRAGATSGRDERLRLVV